MTIGIMPNLTKENVFSVVLQLVEKLEKQGLKVAISDSYKKFLPDNEKLLKNIEVLKNNRLSEISDIVISIGGDGTMLHSAYEVRHYKTPLLGLNFGKLGFLAEFEMQFIDKLIEDIKNKNYIIDERIALEARCLTDDKNDLYAINDLVIDKGKWPKMIRLTIKVDDDYVATFSADGIIIATPTGSTGYSMSVGGPIVNPKTDAIVLSPISPHSLTMRPMVISSDQEIRITVESLYRSIQINSDGQRVHNYEPPATFLIKKSNTPIRLVHTSRTNYFEILRNKLFWGLDIRNIPKVNNE